MPEQCWNTRNTRSSAGLWEMPIAVPDHGKCPICAGSWEMPELCRIMGNARSCAGSWEIAE